MSSAARTGASPSGTDPTGGAWSGWITPPRVIVSTAWQDDGHEWTHASWAYDERLPTYHELVLLRSAVWGSTGWAFQVFAPPTEHVNIHAFALHLWGRVDGVNPFPNFGAKGSI